MVELGEKAKDKITGFKGVVTGIVRYITGCNQALIVPPVGKDGRKVEGEWFDVQRLEVDKKFKKIAIDNAFANGFDQEPPKN